MQFSSSQFLQVASIKHHDRALTLVFGSDGQVSLIGFGGSPSRPLGVPPTLTASNTGAHSLPNGPSSVSTIPNLEATSASFTATSSFTSTTTPITSPSASSTYGSSTTATNTDTNLPSIPTVNYPTPSPTAVSEPNDRGVGAPFYLAVVLASISFIGCVAAFIAWWIRSRARKRDLELEDPWNHRDSISDTAGDNANEIEKGARTQGETQIRPYYLPASIVRRSSSNLLAVPHTIPTMEGGQLQNGFSRTMGRFPSMRHANEPPYQNVISSEATNAPTRPGTQRLQTGLSVQESMHTLGRLRVANRVPGDITSGDEGGMNMPRRENSTSVSPAADYSGPNLTLVGENAIQEPRVHQSDRSPQVVDSDALLEPPGPATLSWGRRIDTVAALRRTRRRTPNTTVQTFKNPGYSGYLYPIPDGGPSGVTRQMPIATNDVQVEHRSLGNPPPDPLGWTNTLKSSFWQAVDVMTGNRPSDIEPGISNVGSGSRFTPAPQRIASRRSPDSPTRFATELTLPDKSVPTQETYEMGVLHVSKDAPGQVVLPPKVSHLNRALGASKPQLPIPLRTNTSSVHSTDSAAARANLRKYGYVDSIPSSWSALSASRESHLDLARTFLPLPRSMRSFGAGSLSITPSQLTLGPSLKSSSASARTRTTTYSESDMIGSDASTLRSGKTANTASYEEATTSSVSRDGTIQSRRSTIGPGMIPPESVSTTSSMLSRKKGVATKRKRPKPPPRAPSTASSVQSLESSLSIREVAVKRALLERRKKVRAVGSLRDREDPSATHGRGASSST